MDFAGLVEPLTPEEFLSGYYGRAPIHICAPQGSDRRRLLDWERLNALLRIQPHWRRENIRVMRNGKAVAPELYMEEAVTQEGRTERASPMKLDALLATGASLVAESIQQASPELRAFSLTLADRLCGRVTVTAFCSFEGVAAFPRHFDRFEVFALQTEGEKTWRIYDCPRDRPLHGTKHHESGAAFEPRGEPPVLLTVTLRPGDVLYIPRGYAHEALASAGESLHLSFAVDPPSGFALFKLLRDTALHESMFRDYLPDAREGDGAALAGHLDRLAERLAAIVRSQAFRDEIATAQMKLAPPPYAQDLPRRPTLDFYVLAASDVRLLRRDEGAALVASERDPLPVGPMREEAEWILAHPMFSLQELAANVPHRPLAEVERLVSSLRTAGLVRAVKASAG